ncbi:hypothetical protein [Mycoplasmopsis pullorum]|uniref:PTS EIIA type-4 domain-containing protein n=1 Tax=Mycoplasmopsis pullorum TaxID=48003 RepID=A0A1L4FR92_9BACT|nr:hypothetical protein [Mycoplasmopsis pullorum]APJ38123.1 hypothetical protein BLA55_00225 [Mycoplasmopsis pullorum]
MKYRVLIIGHAEFPQGVRSFLEFVGGFEEGIQHFFINDEHPTNELREKLEAYFADDTPTLVFADLPGGSPHITIVDYLSTAQKKNVLVYAGLSVALMLDLTFKALIFGANDHAEMVEYCKEKFENLNRFSMQNIF